MAIETATLDVADIVTIVLYFVIVMAVGLFITFRINRGSAAGFFLAGRSMTWLPIAGSLFATDMGAPMMVGLPGSAASQGFSPAMFDWHATYMLILLGWVFIPVYVAAGTYTMPEYLQQRYGGKRLRMYFAIKELILTIIAGISVEMLAVSLFVNQILGWNVYVSSAFMLAITAVYTIGGGLAAVIWTDTVQAAIVIVGTAVLSILAMSKIGGYESMVNQFPTAVSSDSYYEQAKYGNKSCGFPPDDYQHIFRGMDSDYPWPGLIFGLTVTDFAYFCASQVMVQRTLSAKSVTHGKAACILASYLKILPFFLFLWPGMVSRILYPEEVACADPDTCFDICENRSGCMDVAFPLLVLRLLPSGLRGLMLAAMLAASMSSLTSNFNAASAMFTLDIWKYIRPKAKESEVVIVGRLFTVFMIGMSLAWLPVLLNVRGSAIWAYLQSISSYTSPPWVVVFFLGVFWKRSTEQGAWWALLVGLVVGVVRMGIHFSYRTPQCGDGLPDTRPDVFTKMHYLHFAILLAAICAIVHISVSLMTKPRSEAKLRRVTWWTRNAKEAPELSDDEPEVEDENDYIPPEELSCSKNCYNSMCGFNKPPTEKLTEEQLDEQREKFTSVREDPFWSKVCDINAVLVIAFTCFIVGFYA